MIQSDDFTEGGDRGFCIWANYKNTGKSRFECNDGVFRGDVYAKNGIFHGRIEADEGFFRGNLETPVLLATTTPILSAQQYYASGTTRTSIQNSVFSYWGKSVGNSPVTVSKPVVGTYGSKSVIRIVVYDQGRAAVGDISGITLYFSDETDSGLIQSSITESLSFRYSTGGWAVVMNNMQTEDPRIAGVLWRDGTDLKISLG